MALHQCKPIILRLTRSGTIEHYSSIYSAAKKKHIPYSTMKSIAKRGYSRKYGLDQITYFDAGAFYYPYIPLQIMKTSKP